MTYTAHHSHYLSHYITRAGMDEDAFAKSLTAARVDMNPHQVEAALFALQSPLSRGVILADEVGLGKTIEAGLVIAQRWAEQKRKILLIVPASLRKQWQQELYDKFSLRSTILDSKTYKEQKKNGLVRPFDNPKEIVISSYEYASRMADEIALIGWDLVVFDEAHRLRNVFRKGVSVRAKALRDALKSRFKVLLTATPLQNSLMELFGLVSIIDEQHFGGEAAFKALYVGARKKQTALEDLKQRMEPICHRTLRRQVVEAGHLPFTKREAMVFDFTPSDAEQKLYDSISGFLRRKDTIAYGDRTNQLVVLQVRKILGSSTYAITKYLETLIERLKEKRPVDETITDDIDIIDELLEEFDLDGPQEEPTQIDIAALETEIAEVQGYLNLASSITENSKGKKLLAGLPSALSKIEGKGGKRKAVVFTESVRTQTYLKSLLSENGYEGRIVLLNGSNSDPESKGIYKDWLEQHQGTDRISGSRTADMKAAIVEAFKSDDKTILISTESGAEGINLQFCSLVVNFDLPWNPQRVEQRIGRCHRYGQKIDVTVVNMLNLQNATEQRIYDLLDNKFKLFEGVFGSSDEVLGSIEAGVDFEKRVLEIVQSARDNEQVQYEFDALTEQLQDKIDEEMDATRTKLLEEMDAKVVANLKDRNGSLVKAINGFTRRLLMIAMAELPDAQFHEDDKRRFSWKGTTYTTEWPVADDKDWQFFRLSDGNLAAKLVDDSKNRDLSQIAHLDFHPNLYPFDGQVADIKTLTGSSGWLTVCKARIDTPNAIREEMVLACLTDDGESVSAATADRLFQVPSSLVDNGDLTPPTVQISKLKEELFEQFSDRVLAENENWLEQEEARLDAYAEDLELEIEAQIKEIEDVVKDLKKQRRTPGLALTEKLSLGKEIKRLEQQRDDLVLDKHVRRKEVRKQTEDMLDQIAEQLDQKPDITELFTIRWSVSDG